jgi:hypothetical protein
MEREMVWRGSYVFYVGGKRRAEMQLIVKWRERGCWRGGWRQSIVFM